VNVPRDEWPGYNRAVREDPDGVRAVLSAGASADVDVRELAWVIEMESGWNPAAQSPKSSAAGLLQWVKSTRKALGMPESQAQTAAMSRAQQAPFVAKYFEAVHVPGPPPAGDVYLAVFWPEAVGKPASWTIARDDGFSDSLSLPGDHYTDKVRVPRFKAVWRDNPGLRVSPKGPITAGAVRAMGTPPEQGGPGMEDPDAPPDRPRKRSGEPLLWLLALYVLSRKRGASLL